MDLGGEVLVVDRCPTVADDDIAIGSAADRWVTQTSHFKVVVFDPKAESSKLRQSSSVQPEKACDKENDDDDADDVENVDGVLRLRHRDSSRKRGALIGTSRSANKFRGRHFREARLSITECRSDRPRGLQADN
jgi:hypothetical protein